MLVDSAFQSVTDAKHERGSLLVLSCYPLYYPPAKLCRKSRMKIKGYGDDGFQGIDLGSMTVFKRHVSRAVTGRYCAVFQYAVDGCPHLTSCSVEEFRQFPLAHPYVSTGDTHSHDSVIAGSPLGDHIRHGISSMCSLLSCHSRLSWHSLPRKDRRPL